MVCVVGVLLVVIAGWQTASATAALPDGRGYELVSAADKNGGDVMGDPARIRIADDGSAVGYPSLTSFGDVVGSGVAAEYLAVRDPAAGGQGWRTHAISPPQPALSFKGIVSGLEPRYQQEFSTDLRKGVVLGWRPLTDAPAVENVANLYLRDDLRTPSGGNYHLITACPACISPFGTDQLAIFPQFLASTPNLDRLLFESALNLTDEAIGASQKLYQWDEATDTVTLVGILPDGRPAVDSAAGAGHGAFAHPWAISEDGTKVFFTTLTGRVTDVYMRLDGTSTIKLNRSEATAPDPPQSVRYKAASENGERVFFTTTERLTDDTPVTGNTKVYMYDTTLPDSDHNLTLINVDRTLSVPEIADAKDVAGASADGRTVYFTASSQFVAGQPPLRTSTGMFVWHDGEVRFLSNVPPEDETGIGDGRDKNVRVSASGDLVYRSSEPFGPNGYDHGSCINALTGACVQVYVYSIATHTLRCASCNPSGAPGRASASTDAFVNAGGAATAGHSNRVITDDGRYVFFTTGDALVPQDSNGKQDAYEYDTQTGTVSLISSGQDPSDSYYMETSPDGRDALFITRERLVGWDRDSSYDLYDARVGGGLPEPTPEAPACTGEACRGSLAAAPLFEGAASAATRTAGNLAGKLRSRRARATNRRRCRTSHTRKRSGRTAKCIRRTKAHKTRRHTIAIRSVR
jgi:hypothetical protein